RFQRANMVALRVSKMRPMRAVLHRCRRRISYRSLPRLPEDLVLEPRPTCSRCRRPRTHCWCAELQPVSTRTRVVFLQHVRESRVRIGTARMAHLALAGSELHVGTSFPHRPGPRTAVLFPGERALPPAALAEGEPWTLVVVDGTWPQARKLVERDPVL